MDPTTIIWIALLMGLAAALYSTVGHGGASAYLAIMALFAVAPETMRPTALALNLVVAGFGAVRYWWAGQINFRLIAAFLLTAAPAAFIGGGIDIPPELYRPLVGLPCGRRRRGCSGSRRGWPNAIEGSLARRHPARGSGVGLLAGLTGTGGGIFLSPPSSCSAGDARRRRESRPGSSSSTRWPASPAIGRRFVRCPPTCRSWWPRWRRARWPAPGSVPAACPSQDCFRAWAWSWQLPGRSSSSRDALEIQSFDVLPGRSRRIVGPAAKEQIRVGQRLLST